ncbi:MAG: hypothetical protein ACTSPW_18070 [Promethearchaeota archaeon]
MYRKEFARDFNDLFTALFESHSQMVNRYVVPNLLFILKVSNITTFNVIRKKKY